MTLPNNCNRLPDEGEPIDPDRLEALVKALAAVRLLDQAAREAMAEVRRAVRTGFTDLERCAIVNLLPDLNEACNVVTTAAEREFGAGFDLAGHMADEEITAAAGRLFEILKIYDADAKRLKELPNRAGR